MAEIPLAALGRLCAPATEIVATIPRGFLAHGGRPLAACPSARPLTEFFAADNPIVVAPEEAALNAHFAVCST